MDSFIEPSSVVSAEHVKNMAPSTALRDPLTVRGSYKFAELVQAPSTTLRDPLTVRDPWIAKAKVGCCFF